RPHGFRSCMELAHFSKAKIPHPAVRVGRPATLHLCPLPRPPTLPMSITAYRPTTKVDTINRTSNHFGRREVTDFGPNRGSTGVEPQTRAAPSPLAVTSFAPSGLHAADKTTAVCPVRVRTSAPAVGSQIRAVRSWLPVTTRIPSGLQAAEVTALVCPLS